MRVLLSGYYGFGNLGDEALLEVIVTQLRERFAGIDIDVLSNDPASTARLGVEATPRWEWRAIRAAIGRADVVVSGGGGLLQNATSLRSLLYYAAILREAIRAKKKTMIFAQSIGPLDLWGRFVVRRFCKGLDRATVRDERSRALLGELFPGTPSNGPPIPSSSTMRRANPSICPPKAWMPAVRRTRSSACVRSPTFAKVPARSRAPSTAWPKATACASRSCRLAAPADAEVSTDVIRACSSARCWCPMSAAESRRNHSRRARRDRHAPARVDPGGALRRSVSRDSLRSEGRGALRRPCISARTAVGARPAAPRRAPRPTR